MTELFAAVEMALLMRFCRQRCIGISALFWGIFLAGTTNDFAAGLKLPSDIREAAVNIVRGTPHTVDAGLFNTSYFSYVASFGAFTETSYSTPQNFKNALGHLAYILEGIKEIPAFTSYTVCVEADGQIYKDSYIFGAVSNARSVGGILKISDSLVDLNDGVFEVMMIKMPKTLMDLSAIVDIADIFESAEV